MQERVWVASEGDVFNLKFRGVFSTPEKAQAHLKKRVEFVFPKEPVIWRKDTDCCFIAEFGRTGRYRLEVLGVVVDFYENNFYGQKRGK